MERKDENKENTDELTDGGENAVLSETDAQTAAAQPAKKPLNVKRIKSVLWNVFLVAVIAVGIISLLGVVKEIGHDGSSFGEVMRGASPLFFVVLAAVVAAGMALDVAKFCIIGKTVTGKYRLGASIKTNFLGKYYDAVTPFATGGQPMQIYYLNTKGISGGNSSATSSSSVWWEARILSQAPIPR